MSTLEATGYRASAIVLNPSDFESIELALSTTNAVEHLGLPWDPAQRRLYGVPIATTIAQTAGVGHVLAEGAVGVDNDAQGIQLVWSETSNADDFSNRLTAPAALKSHSFSKAGGVLNAIGYQIDSDNAPQLLVTFDRDTADQSGREVTLLTFGTPELAAILPKRRKQTDRETPSTSSDSMASQPTPIGRKDGSVTPQSGPKRQCCG
jgi:hypothetical protein